jgi:uncharacterized protein (DUF2141 family)
MKIITTIVLSLLTGMAFGAPVEMNVSNFLSREGTLMVAVFNDAGNFPDKVPFKSQMVTIKAQQSLNISIDLPEGDYAITMFLDQNGNKKLDTNFLGIPKELFGFSNNPSIRTGAPNFQECEFRVKASDNKLSVKLKKLL